MPTLNNSILDYELLRTRIRELQEPVHEIPASEQPFLINENVELVFEDPSKLRHPTNTKNLILPVPVRRINSKGIKVVKYGVFTYLN